MKKTLISIAAITIFFTGCGVKTPKPSDENYKKGYDSGCEAGIEAAKNSFFVPKKPKNYFENEMFKKGWKDGFEECKEDEEFRIWMRYPAIFYR